MSRLSSLVRTLPPSATVHINDVSNQMIAKGQHVFKWGLGQSPFPVFPLMVDALKHNAHRKEYVTSQGLPELRRTIAEFHDTSEENVLVGPGSKELFFVMQMCLQSDLVLPVGSWVSYFPQAALLGRNTTYLRAKDGNPKWLLRGEDIEAFCKDDPTRERLLILNYPNNPTGATYSADELRDLAQAIRRFPNMTVLSDEIYSGITHDSVEHVSISQFAPEQTVVSNGISKWLGAGGYRLGYMVFDPSMSWLRSAMTNVATETFTSVSAPIQCAAIEGFKAVHHLPNNALNVYLQRKRKILTTLATRLVDMFRQAGIQVARPDGGFYMSLSFKNFSDRFKTDEDVVEWALKERRVAFLPGSNFGWQPEELFARISYVNFDGEAALEAVERGEEIDDKFIEKYCQETLEAAKSLCDGLLR